MNSTKCADCGKPIWQDKRHRWFSMVNETERSYACRVDVRNGRLVLADYHCTHLSEQVRIRGKQILLPDSA